MIRIVLLFVLFTTMFTNCERLWFTGLDPDRLATSPLIYDSGANHIYRYKEGEILNITCEANTTDTVTSFQYFSPDANSLWSLNTTFERKAHISLDGSSLFCSSENIENGTEYSIIVVLKPHSPEKLWFTGLHSDRKEVTAYRNGSGEDYVYKYKDGEYLNIGCAARIPIETKRFMFYNSSTKMYKHLFHTQFKHKADYDTVRRSRLHCSYENQEWGTNYTIRLQLKLYTPPYHYKHPHTQAKSFVSLKTIIIVAGTCTTALVLFLAVDFKILADLTSNLLLVSRSTLKKFSLEELRKKMRKKETANASAVLLAEQWAKVVRVEIIPGTDSSIMPIISIDKVRYTEFSKDMKASDLSSEYILPADNKWELPRENLTFGDILGQGEFGKVLKAEYTGTVDSRLPRTVAVKMLKDGHCDADMIALVSEMEIMKVIGKHENVVNLLGCCTQDGPLCVVVEYASNGCLKEYLQTHDPNRSCEGLSQQLTERELVEFALQVARGMEFLVSRGCIHRDLAARNILVSSERILKIADFGLARDVRDSDYYRKRSAGKLPVRWMAPESLGLNYYTEHSDVWSYGVLFWEIMTFGCTPYRQISVHFLYDYLKSGQRLDQPDGCRKIIYDLMMLCWTFEPENRPRFSEIVINLEGILNEL